MLEARDFNALLDQIYDGLVEVDALGYIKRWNKGAERLTGYEARSIVGRHFQRQPAKHVSPSGQQLADAEIPLLLTIKDGVPREAIAHRNHAEGYRVSLITRSFPIFAGSDRPAGGIEIFSDNKALIAGFLATISGVSPFNSGCIAMKDSATGDRGDRGALS